MEEQSFKKFKVMAQMFVGQLLKGDFTAAASRFDDQMKNVFGEDKLKESWLNLVMEAGSLLQMNPTQTAEAEGYKIVIIRCQFQQVIIDIQVVFNDQEQIGGLNFTPTKMDYSPPEYVNESAFHEVDVTVGEGKWALPGTLTLPEGSGPFPGVVLVHGSGPNDRDETIGPNKTFKDMAWGLASKGIAVLRYDKRTFTHAKQFTPDLVEKLTGKEEAIDDALLAVQLMRQTEGIDPKQVYLLGHSLGATLAPRIGQEDPELAGLIIMAGITRSLEDTILDQFTYIYGLADTMAEQQKTELEELKEKVARVKSPDLADMSPQDLPLGISAAYWIDLRDHNPADIVKTLNMPILVLQGERDYQVLKTEDFEGWKAALNHKPNAAFKLFPKLNHLFIEGEGNSTPQEYLIEGHVKEDVVNTIAQWIESIKSS